VQREHGRDTGGPVTHQEHGSGEPQGR
jgi:hypothetical protein